MDQPLLRIERLTKRFGGVLALNDVSFSVRKGDVVGLIGPNGSGKTTLFHCITGFLEPDPPSHVEVMGESIKGKGPDRIALMGIVRTFQELRVFRRLSVIENLLMSAQQYQEDKIVPRFLNTGVIRAHEARAKERARELLELLNLSSSAGKTAGSLSFGQRKLLSLASALMPDPQLILLDEPVAAVNPVLIDKIKEFILDMKCAGKTFLLIEHNMGVVLDICDRIVVLDHGERIAEGAPQVIRTDPRVIDAYFGT